jgi:hypothetical protein
MSVEIAPTLYDILAESGSFPNMDGYAEIQVPSDLIGNIGYVIGRNGFYFKKITEASGTSYIWFNKKTGNIEVYCLDTSFDMSSRSFHHPDDVIGATPEDVEEEMMDQVSENLQSARDRIYDRFERCREELGGKSREFTLADYMHDL